MAEKVTTNNYFRIFKSHFRRRKSKRTKRLFDQMVPVKGKGYQKRIRRLAPYMKKYKAKPSARTAK